MSERVRDDDELVQVDIDHRRKITGAQARVQEKEGKIEGLRLIDEDGNFVFDETWYSFGEPEPWGDVASLPEDARIIGYSCETEGYEINRLTLKLW